jgi:hypothetical protein
MDNHYILTSHKVNQFHKHDVVWISDTFVDIVNSQNLVICDFVE